MAKKYVVEYAELNCQYGEKSWIIMKGRNIKNGDRTMANEEDYSQSCLICGGFKNCHSPHLLSAEVSQSVHDGLKEGGIAASVHQLLSMGSTWACVYPGDIPWLDTKEDVFIDGKRALLEDSWTFCSAGLGIISFVNSGQGENVVESLEKRLDEVESIVDSYMKENGIEEEKRDMFLNAAVLWGGYNYIPWDMGLHKNHQELWDFEVYMEENHPTLVNYFDRGIYLHDEGTNAQIDLSYLAGISVAHKQDKSYQETYDRLLMPDTLVDEGVYNAYLEARRQEKSDNGVDAIKNFLKVYQSADYDGASRYSDFLTVEDLTRENFITAFEAPINPTNEKLISVYRATYKPKSWGLWSWEEKDLWIINNSLEYFCSSSELSHAFIDKVCDSAGRKRMKWE